MNLKIYSSSMSKLYTKLVDFPRSIDFAKDKDFWAALKLFRFQFAFRAFFFDFDVRFLGTAMMNSVLIRFLLRIHDRIGKVNSKVGLEGCFYFIR